MLELDPNPYSRSAPVFPERLPAWVPSPRHHRPDSDAERRRSRCHSCVLYAAHLVPALPWSLMPVPPPRRAEEPFVGVLGGLWGLVYAVLEPRPTALRGWWA